LKKRAESQNAQGETQMPSTDEFKKKAKWLEGYYLHRVKEEPGRKDWEEGLDTARRWIGLLETPTRHEIENLLKFLKDHEHEHGPGWFEMKTSVQKWIDLN
jgi:hypothetical protein